MFYDLLADTNQYGTLDPILANVSIQTASYGGWKSEQQKTMQYQEAGSKGRVLDKR